MSARTYVGTGTTTIRAATHLPTLDPFRAQSISQKRTLFNAGVHAELTIQKGINNIKAGTVYEHTFLREHDNLGIVNATFNSPCVDADGNPQPGFTDPSQCAAAGLVSNDPSVGGTFNPVLLPYDLTRGGSLYGLLRSYGRQGTGPLSRGSDQGRKLGLQPRYPRRPLQRIDCRAPGRASRLASAYNIKPTNTVLRVSYARTLETPFNENLVLSSQGCSNDVLSPLLACTPGVSGTLQPGFRNEFHAGLQQAFGKNFVVSGDYIWKYTHNAFDFSVLGNTPITFPIDWHNSKIPGFTLRADVPNYPWHLGVRGDVVGCCPLLPAADRRRRRDGRTERASVPHRS